MPSQAAGCIASVSVLCLPFSVLCYNGALPEYMTQSETVEELEENLIDISETLTKTINTTPSQGSGNQA